MRHGRYDYTLPLLPHHLYYANCFDRTYANRMDAKILSIDIYESLFTKSNGMCDRFKRSIVGRQQCTVVNTGIGIYRLTDHESGFDQVPSGIKDL